MNIFCTKCEYCTSRGTTTDRTTPIIYIKFSDDDWWVGRRQIIASHRPCILPASKQKSKRQSLHSIEDATKKICFFFGSYRIWHLADDFNLALSNARSCVWYIVHLVVVQCLVVQYQMQNEDEGSEPPRTVLPSKFVTTTPTCKARTGNATTRHRHTMYDMPWLLPCRASQLWMDGDL